MALDRQRLARWVVGSEIPEGPWTNDNQIDAMLALARAEGVTCLLERSQRERFEAASASDSQQGARWHSALRDAARREALSSMMLEAETRRVLGVLDALGIEGLLLKGSALAYWAYPEPHLRACGDIDVLLSTRADAERLADALVAQGYNRAATSGNLVAHELMCTRRMTSEWMLEVDVHWRLNNTTLFAHRFEFDELMATSIALPRLAPNARGLGPVDALIHAAVHRARNLANGTGDGLKWLYDLVPLTTVFSAGDWTEAVEIARQKQLAGVTLSALEAAEKMFACPVPGAVKQPLQDAAAVEPLDVGRLGDWRYMQVQNFRSVSGFGPRLRWLWQRLFPSGDDMRHMYGMDSTYVALLWERGQRFWKKWRQR